MLKDFNNFAIWDVETTGLRPFDRGTALLESAVGHFTPKGLKIAAYGLAQPLQKTFEGYGGLIPQSEFSYWAQKKIMGQIGYGKLTKYGKPPQEVWQKTLEALKGKTVWVQNLRFEARHLAGALSEQEFSRFAQEAKLETYSPFQKQIYTTPPKVEQAVSKAFQAGLKPTGDYLSSWKNVYGEMRQLEQTPFTRFLDIQDLTRSTLAMAQSSGYMPKTMDVFSGTSVDIWSRITKNVNEKHRAIPDVRQEGEMLQFMLGAAEKLYTGERLSEGEAGYFHRLGKLQRSIRYSNRAKTLAEAYQSFQTYGSYDVVGSYEDISVEAMTRKIIDGQETEMPIQKIISVPQKYKVKTPEALIDYLAQRDSIRQLEPIDYNSLSDYVTKRVIAPHQDKMRELISSGVLESEAKVQTKPYLEKLMFEMERNSTDEFLSNDVVSGLKEPFIPSPFVGQRQKMGKFLGRKWPYFAVVAGGLLAFRMLSSKDDSHNTIVGMPETGWFSKQRSLNTEFGSGYTASLVQDINDLQVEGLNNQFQAPLVLLDVDKDSISVNDADTINLEMENSRLQFRLVGIDAPEISHPEENLGSRVYQDQAFGKESIGLLNEIMDQQDSLQLLFNPEAPQTYGRVPAILLGEKKLNINLELLRKGAASYLPWGTASEQLISRPVFLKTQRSAYSQMLGMWRMPEWQNEYYATQKLKRTITHNTLTDPSRLQDDFAAATLLRRMRFSDDYDLAKDFTVGGKDDFNVLTGMQEGWFGSQRGDSTDFGSGWRGLGVIIERFGGLKKFSTGRFEEIIKSTGRKVFVDEKGETLYAPGYDVFVLNPRQIPEGYSQAEAAAHELTERHFSKHSLRKAGLQESGLDPEKSIPDELVDKYESVIKASGFSVHSSINVLHTEVGLANLVGEMAGETIAERVWSEVHNANLLDEFFSPLNRYKEFGLNLSETMTDKSNRAIIMNLAKNLPYRKNLSEEMKPIAELADPFNQKKWANDIQKGMRAYQKSQTIKRARKLQQSHKLANTTLQVNMDKSNLVRHDVKI